MFKTRTWALLTTIAATAMFTVTINAQDCQSCNSGYGYAPAASFQPASPSVFGYPGGSCDSCGSNCGGSCQAGRNGGGLGRGHLKRWHDEVHAHIDHMGKINDIVSARNAAWPKPFECGDRQIYFRMWEPMLDNGWREACVLSNLHFSESNSLNEAGKVKIAMIMRNNPTGQKSVFVARDHDAEDLDARLANVKSTVNQWYGMDNVNEIAFTDLTPIRGSGMRFETINQLGTEGTAPPVIPVASGTGSTSDVSSGN